MRTPRARTHIHTHSYIYIYIYIYICINIPWYVQNFRIDLGRAYIINSKKGLISTENTETKANNTGEYGDLVKGRKNNNKTTKEKKNPDYLEELVLFFFVFLRIYIYIYMCVCVCVCMCVCVCVYVCVCVFRQKSFIQTVIVNLTDKEHFNFFYSPYLIIKSERGYSLTWSFIEILHNLGQLS